jgi:hypothetical protein
VTIEHHEPTVEHEEELMSGLALLGEDAVETYLDLIGQLSKALQLVVAHAREERDALQVLELLVACHVCASLRRQQ